MKKITMVLTACLALSTLSFAADNAKNNSTPPKKTVIAATETTTSTIKHKTKHRTKACTHCKCAAKS